MKSWFALLAALALPFWCPATAAAQQPGCTVETLPVRGVPVTIGYCVTAPPRATGPYEIVVPAMATYQAPGGQFSRPLELHFVSGEGVSRVLQNVKLQPLGMRGTLHLTLAWYGGLVRIEGALLTPGAITIK